MSIETQIKTAMLRMIRDNGHPKAHFVTSWDEEAYEQGGCPTCWGGIDYEVLIYYREEDNTSGSYKYEGKFSDLIEWLDHYSD